MKTLSCSVVHGPEANAEAVGDAMLAHATRTASDTEESFPYQPLRDRSSNLAFGPCQNRLVVTAYAPAAGNGLRASAIGCGHDPMAAFCHLLGMERLEEALELVLPSARYPTGSPPRPDLDVVCPEIRSVERYKALG